MVTSDNLIDAAISCEAAAETVGASNTYGLGTVLRTLAVMARSMSHDSEISHLKDALRPLAELPVGTELLIDDESLDTVLYKNGDKSITARDVMIARGHSDASQGSAYEIMSDAKDEILVLRKKLEAIDALVRSVAASKEAVLEIIRGS